MHEGNRLEEHKRKTSVLLPQGRGFVGFLVPPEVDRIWGTGGSY